MNDRSQTNANIIAGWLIEVLGRDGFEVEIIKLDSDPWFHSDELYNHLNGHRYSFSISDGHKLYPMNLDEYCVADIERRPTVYVNGMGAIKMLHNVISPVTTKIFKRVGLNRIKQIIDNGTLLLY